MLAGLAAGLLAPAARAQGFAGLGTAEDGFALPDPATRLRFPRDHGAHPRFRIEWWYLTANLRSADGRPHGIQWTLFRTAIRPGETAGWSSPQIWFAHAAATGAGSHAVAETFARGGIGQAGVTATPFAAWINDWSLAARASGSPTPGADPLDRLGARASGDGFAYDLALDAGGAPLVLHGAAGHSVKSHEGHASHYYSQPHYRVSGSLRLGTERLDVTGQAWLDREWSSQALRGSQTGWDWMALHLADGRKLMVGRVRDTSGPDFRFGTLAFPDGGSRYVPGETIALTPGTTTRVAGRRVPTAWRLEVTGEGIALDLAALNPLSWMRTAISYWEGPVATTGSHDGEGYLEMTGYE